MENFIGAAAIAAISALAIIAYRHPDDFKSIGESIGLLLDIGFSAVLVWALALFFAERQLIVADLHSVPVERTLDTLSPFSYPIQLLGIYAFRLYLTLLMKLPKILNLEKEQDVKDKDNGK